MAHNIEIILQRQQRLEILVDRTDELLAAASEFRKTSTMLTNRLWWKDRKWKIAILLVILVVLAVIVLAILGSKGII
jgi:energy-coupling factor transporter transmembrane protein EcfT